MSLPDRIAILNSDGTTDVSFDPGLGLDAATYAVAVLPSGEVLAGGSFAQANLDTRQRLALFESDGAVSQTFDVAPNNTVRTMALQTNGAVVFGGAFTSVDGSTRNRVARLDTDLSLEPAYNPNANNTVYAIANQSDGKTLIGGAFTTMGGTTRNGVARLFNDEAPTTLTVLTVDLIRWLRGGASAETERVTFDLSTDGGSTYSSISGAATRVSGGWEFVPGVSLSGTGLIRARAYPTDSHSEGIVQETVSFNADPEIEVSVDGVVLTDGVSTVDYADTQVGGTTDKVVTITNRGLSNLTLTGTPVTLATGTQWSVVSQPVTPVAAGASVTFTLRFSPTSTGAKTDTVTVNSDDADEGTFTFGLTGDAVPGPGSADTTWQPVLNGIANGAVENLSDIIWLVGNFTTANALSRQRVARINDTGSVQAQTGSVGNGVVNCACRMPDGKVIIGGTFTSVSGVTRNRLARFNSDGSFDATFNVSANGDVLGLALQADGAVVVTGTFTTLGGQSRNCIGRITSAGALDSTFAPALGAASLTAAIQTDGKIIVSGLFSVSGRQYLARLNSDGSVDSTFTASANNIVSVSAITSDGKIIAGGIYTSIGGAAKTGVNRLSSTGTHDNTFSEVVTAAQSLALQCDGKLIIGSYINGSLTSTERLTRRTTAGANDSTFVATARNIVQGVTLTSEGKPIVTGNFTLAGGSPLFAARLVNDANGAVSSLSVVSNTEVQWLRSGTVPEAQIVVFDYSQDSGSTWTRLGQGTRVTNGWSLTGISLPISGLLRSQAFIPCGYFNGSTTIHEEQVSFSNLDAADLVLEYPVGTVINDLGTLSFPGTLPGQTTDLVVTLRNTGNATLSSIAASTSGDFSIQSSPATSLAANGSTTMTIRFAPTAIGARTAYVSVTSSVPGSKNPYALLMTGNGVTVPTATTGSNSAPVSGQRTLNGVFKANHDTATAYFQYKLASSSTWLDSAASTISGFSNTSVQKTITGLTVGQSYQYRAIVYNAVNAGQAPASPFAGAITTFTAT